MQQINNYIMSMAYASVIVAVLLALVPKGPAKTLIGVISGVVLVIIMCAPLPGMDFNQLIDSLDLTENMAARKSQDYQADQDALIKELIENKTSAYILSKAQALGVDCRVSVRLDDGSPPAPATVYISGPEVPDGDALRRLSEILALDCGIPADAQFFNWGEG